MIGAHDKGMTEGTFLTFDSNMHLTGKGTLIYNSYRAGLSATLAPLPFPRELTLNQIRNFSSVNFLIPSEI